MKNKIYKTLIILLFTLVTLVGHSQSIFKGTWEYQSGNEIFRVILWEDTREGGGQVINGHYEKVIVNGDGAETFVYCSDKERYLGQNKAWLPFVIYGSEDNQLLSGTFTDNTVDQSQYDQQKRGQLRMEILSNSGGVNPVITCSWKIQRGQGPILNESPDYSVPTDIVLTKVN